MNGVCLKGGLHAGRDDVCWDTGEHMRGKQDEQVQGRGSVILALGCQRASAYSTLTALLLLP